MTWPFPTSLISSQAMLRRVVTLVFRMLFKRTMFTSASNLLTNFSSIRSELKFHLLWDTSHDHPLSLKEALLLLPIIILCHIFCRWLLEAIWFVYPLSSLTSVCWRNKYMNGHAVLINSHLTTCQVRYKLPLECIYSWENRNSSLMHFFLASNQYSQILIYSLHQTMQSGFEHRMTL